MPSPLKKETTFGQTKQTLSCLVNEYVDQCLKASVPKAIPQHGLHKVILPEVEKLLITRVLEHVQGNRKQAALILGINRTTLLKRIREHALDGAEKE